MQGKPKIIFVGDYSREDYVSLLKAAKSYCDFYFLFYASPNEEKSSFYKKFGKAIYWKDFSSAQHLLEQLKPNKVVFLYVESYNHVVLNLACRQVGIPTYLLEHGLRADYVVGFDRSISPGKPESIKDKLTYLGIVARDLTARIKSRAFLKNSIAALPPDDSKFAQEFVNARRGHNYLETFRAIQSEKRLTDTYIGFSPKIYDTFKEHEAAYFGSEVQYIGIPYFDKLASTTAMPLSSSILFLDQPLAEQRLLKWDMGYKKQFACALANICEASNYRLYIKPHPKQDFLVWKELEREGKCFVVDDEELTQIAGSIPMVLGFYSTYLMPFAAFEHTTLLTYERHPAGNLLVSKPFTDAGVAEPIYTLDVLKDILQNPAPLHQQQLPNKAKFTADWMYKFDGKSGERLREILLS